MLHDTKISNENYDKKATSYTYHGPFHNNVEEIIVHAGIVAIFPSSDILAGKGKKGGKSGIGLAIYIAELCNFIGTLSTT